LETACRQSRMWLKKPNPGLTSYLLRLPRSKPTRNEVIKLDRTGKYVLKLPHASRNQTKKQTPTKIWNKDLSNTTLTEKTQEQTNLTKMIHTLQTNNNKTIHNLDHNRFDYELCTIRRGASNERF
jgi:hypothetical protein